LTAVRLAHGHPRPLAPVLAVALPWHAPPSRLRRWRMPPA